MHPLHLARHLPPRTTAPVALALDRVRAGRVDALIASHPDVVAVLHEAMTTLDRGPDPAAERCVERYALMMLCELRRPAGLEPRYVCAARLDALVRSQRGEWMDRAAPPWLKRIEMRLLDRLNRNLDSYRTWSAELASVLQGTEAPRLVDLAAGSGGFSRWLAHDPPVPGLRLQSTDLDPAYVAQGRRLARRARLPVEFSVLDALDLRPLRGEVDLFVCTQSTHHLAPGMLVRMLREAMRAAPLGIVVIDLVRSLLNVAAAGVVTTLTAPYLPLWLDGMQSIRRAYLPTELRLLARLAGAGTVDVHVARPAFAVMHAQA